MGRRQYDEGHTAVVESILVGFTVIAAVAFVAAHAEPPTTQSQARGSLQTASADALYVLAELPATSGTPHESLLEEYITEGLRGDCSNLTQKLKGYYAPGVVWNLSLEKGHGSATVVCSTEDRSGASGGERTTTSTTIQPNWNKLFVVPNVTQINGIVELDLLGNVVDADTLALQGVLVRTCYVDETTSVTLTFPNGYSAAFNSKGGVRYTGPLMPAHVTSGGYRDGFSVPYNTSSTWEAYQLSTLDLTQPEGSYGVRHNLGSISELEAVDYEVHPVYTLSGTISSTIETMDEDSKFKPDAQKAHLGSSMSFSWNYGTIANTISTLRLADGDITVYNPVGAVAKSMKANSVHGSKSFEIEKEMLWGTYVAHLQLHFEEVDVSGVSTGNIYIVNQLGYFSVMPPEWADLPKYIPPVYRVTLTAGYPDWQ